MAQNTAIDSTLNSLCITDGNGLIVTCYVDYSKQNHLMIFVILSKDFLYFSSFKLT